MQITQTNWDSLKQFKNYQDNFSLRYASIQNEIAKTPNIDMTPKNPNHGQMGHKGYKRFKLKFVVERFRKVHGDKYYYTNAVYKNQRTPIRVMCPDHGEFSILPIDHWNGKGCEHCKSEKYLSRQRKVTEMREDGMTFSAIAKIFGVSVSTVCRDVKNLESLT